MPWISGAIIAGGSLLSGAMSSSAAGNAADAQRQASQSAIDEQRSQYDQTRSDNAPFVRTGTAANQRLAQLLGLNSGLNSSDLWGIANNPALSGTLAGNNWSSEDLFNSLSGHLSKGVYGDDRASQLAAIQSSFNAQGLGDLTSGLAKAPGTDQASGTDSTSGKLTRDFTAADLNADPVYNSGLQFGLDQGRDAINARAMATGSYDSGATLKALTRFGNDYGSTKAGDAYNRFQTNQGNTYNRLAGISGTGQTAVGQVSSAGQNMANNVSGLQTGIGNANAAGIVGGANAWGGALSSAATGYQNNMILQKLLGNSGGGSGGGYTGANDPYIGAGADQYSYLGSSY